MVFVSPKPRCSICGDNLCEILVGQEIVLRCFKCNTKETQSEHELVGVSSLRYCANCHVQFDVKDFKDYLCDKCKEKVFKEYKEKNIKDPWEKHCCICWSKIEDGKCPRCKMSHERIKNQAMLYTSVFAEKQSKEDLLKKIVKLKIEVHNKDESLRTKNILLDGLLAVWCDGGCPGGVGRYTEIEITEETVKKVEENTKRLRTWFENKKARDNYKKEDCKK